MMPATPYRMLSHASMPALTQTAHDRTARGSVKISKLFVEISKLSVASAGNARAVVSLSQVEIFSKFRFLRSKFRRRNFSDPSSVLRLLRHGGRLAVPASQRHGMPGGIVTGSLCRPMLACSLPLCGRVFGLHARSGREGSYPGDRCATPM